jgi:hypothetical protein
MSLPREAPPPSVVNAVRLMLLRSAVSVGGVLVLFGMRDDLKRRYLRSNPDASPSDANVQLTVAVVTTVVILVFYVFLAFQVRKGAPWARITTWVIAGLGILGALLSFGQPDPPLSRVLGVLVGIIDVAVVVLLARRDSNAFFKNRP